MCEGNGMDAELWTSNPSTLLLNIFQLTPSNPASQVARANAAARFVVLWCLVATIAFSLLSGGFKPHFFIIGAVILATTGLRDAGQQTKPSVPSEQPAREMKFCEAPTVDNPLGNPMPTDYGKPGKLPACPSDNVASKITQSINELPLAKMVSSKSADPFQQEIANRSFYSLPATTVPNSVENFRHAIASGGVGRRMDHGFDDNIFSRGLA